MRGRGICALFALMLVAPLAQADFRAALSQYQAGNYTVAQREFLALARLGDGASQYNLGAMALQGQGGAVDRGDAVGWFTAARQNGHDSMAVDKLSALRAKLTPEEDARAERILATYGSAALADSVLPPPRSEFHCDGYTALAARALARPPYAYAARQAGRSGVAIVSFTVGTDGLAYDQNIVTAVPAREFGSPAVDALLASRFTPATQGGAPVEGRGWTWFGFRLDGGVSSIWDRETLGALRYAASTGDPDSQYLYGTIAILDPALGLSRDDGEALVLQAAQGGQSEAQYWIGMTLDAQRPCVPDGLSMVWLRAAAQGGHAAARVALADRLLEGEPDAARINEARQWYTSVVGSDNNYATKHAIAQLAASPHEALRDPQAALRAASTLFGAGNLSKDPQTQEALAAARAANGDFKGAVAAQQNAIEAATKLYWNTARMHERLTAYQSNRMWYGNLLEVPPSIRVLPDPRP